MFCLKTTDGAGRCLFVTMHAKEQVDAPYTHEQQQNSHVKRVRPSVLTHTQAHARTHVGARVKFFYFPGLVNWSVPEINVLMFFALHERVAVRLGINAGLQCCTWPEGASR